MLNQSECVILTVYMCGLSVSHWLSMCGLSVTHWLSMCGLSVSHWLSMCGLSVSHWLSMCGLSAECDTLTVYVWSECVTLTVYVWSECVTLTVYVWSECWVCHTDCLCVVWVWHTDCLCVICLLQVLVTSRCRTWSMPVHPTSTPVNGILTQLSHCEWILLSTEWKIVAQFSLVTTDRLVTVLAHSLKITYCDTVWPLPFATVTP